MIAHGTDLSQNQIVTSLQELIRDRKLGFSGTTKPNADGHLEFVYFLTTDDPQQPDPNNPESAEQLDLF